MTLSDHLREIYNLSPDAIRALLGNDDEALDIHEINALLFEFTRPANGPFLKPYTVESAALFSAAGKVAMWVMAEYQD